MNSLNIPNIKQEKIKLYGKKIKYMAFQRAVTEPISKGLYFCNTWPVRRRAALVLSLLRRVAEALRELSWSQEVEGRSAAGSIVAGLQVRRGRAGLGGGC